MNSQSRFRFLLSAALLLAVALLAFGVLGGGHALAAPAAAPLPPGTACTRTGTSTVTCNLWAKTGTLSLPGAVTVPVWGYTDSVSGSAQIPGPMLEAVSGDTVTVNLTNNLGAGRSTSLSFEGQAMIPDTTGVGDGLTKSYTFNATDAGTFLYEAGPIANAQHQVAMGLLGALVVRPAGASTQAFANAATAFDDEALVVLSEIDPALNTLANPATFDMRNFKAKYRLVNGKAYPQTDLIASTASSRLLLRYVNGGQEEHTMTLLGVAAQQFLSVAGQELPYYRRLLSELLLPGQSATALAVIPASAPAGARFALYDGNLLLHNNGAQGFGGMLTFVTIAPGLPGGDTVGPSMGSLTLLPNPTTGVADVALSASISDVASGNSNIAAAEYRIDSTGAAPHAMTATDSAFDSPTEAVQGTITVADMTALASGTHRIYVRGQDAAGNWGSFNFIVLNLDKTGPTTRSIGLTPAVSNGDVSVAISATGDDSATGGANVTAAQYQIDGAGTTAMTVSGAGSIVSLNATISALPTMGGLSEGAHTLSVRSQDAALNWGAYANADLLVDNTGPVASGIVAMPNPTNGAIGYNPITPSIRVNATLSDPMVPAVAGARSTVTRAEGFIDTVGALASGFGFTPLDGLFDSITENAYAFIPLTTISALSQGSHTIYVRGKDAAGNWGATGTVTLIVDKSAPTVSGLTLTPSAANNTAVAISAVASDTASGNLNIVAGEYFIDTVGADGTGIAMSVSATAPTANLNATISAATVAALTVGNHTVYVHAKDAPGNWGTRVNATLVIDRTAPTFSSITLTPNSIAAGTASVTLTVNGSSDGVGGSGVAGGEYWVCSSTCTNPGTGGGTAFTGLTATIPTGSFLAGHQYTMRTRIRDAAGNWSTGGNGIRSATLTVTTANNIFTDGFESGSLPGNWTSRSTANTTRLNVTTPALFGAFAMQAQGNNANYVQYNFSSPAAIYDARFYFRPNGNNSTGKDILATATTSGFGTTVFRVRYRLNGTTPQVQIQVGTANTNTTWTNVTGGAFNNVIEVVWQSGSSLQLHVNGVLAQTLTPGAGSVAAVRLGSVTNTGNATLMYFDAFASKSTASPLIGP